MRDYNLNNMITVLLYKIIIFKNKIHFLCVNKSCVFNLNKKIFRLNTLNTHGHKIINFKYFLMCIILLMKFYHALKVPANMYLRN